MITIDQLLESVDLDFEPRWVTKNANGGIYVWTTRPQTINNAWRASEETAYDYIAHIKLSEFDGKIWTECIYEVPRKTIGKIEKIHIPDMDEVAESAMYSKELAKRLNQVIDAINELKGAK